jgi:hypothetical protein
MDKNLIGLLPQDDDGFIVTYDSWHVGSIQPVDIGWSATVGSGADAEQLGAFDSQDEAKMAVIQATT